MSASKPAYPTRAPFAVRSSALVALVAVAHAGVGYALLASSPRSAPDAPKALAVRLIQAESPPTRVPVPETRPRPVRPAQPTATPQPVPAPALIASSATPSPAPVPEIQAPRASAAEPASTPVTAPRFDAAYLDNPAPAYPSLSRRLGESGKVVLRVFVDAEGRPAQIEVRSSSGSTRLDAAAQDAVRQWKFIPARRGDDPLAAWVLVPLVFNLSS